MIDIPDSCIQYDVTSPIIIKFSAYINKPSNITPNFHQKIPEKFTEKYSIQNQN